MKADEKKEIVVYNGAGDVKLEVLTADDTVWLNRQQLALLFGRDVKTIGKHIANALKEELKGVSTVAKFATVQTVDTLMPPIQNRRRIGFNAGRSPSGAGETSGRREI